MPALVGKRAAQEKLLRNLPAEFAAVQREHHLPPGAPASRPLLPVLRPSPPLIRFYILGTSLIKIHNLGSHLIRIHIQGSPLAG